MAKINILFIITLCLSSFPLYANGAFDQTQRGTKAFEQELFGNAQAAFQETLGKRQGRAEAHYNLGTALYKNENYVDSEKEFLSAAEKTRKKELAASSYYNAGNAALKIAQTPGKESDVKEARNRAIDHYRRALRINPDHAKAAHNLEKLYQLNQQEQEQQSQNSQQSSGQDQQEQSSPQDQQNSAEGEQQQQAQGNTSEQSDDNSESEQQAELSENKQDQEKQQEGALDEAEDLIDREEAQQEMRNRQQQNNLQVERDW